MIHRASVNGRINITAPYPSLAPAHPLQPAHSPLSLSPRDMPVSLSPSSRRSATIFTFLLHALSLSSQSYATLNSTVDLDESLVYIWPLPTRLTHGNETLTVDPALVLTVDGDGGGSEILRAAFERYKKIIFKDRSRVSRIELGGGVLYDVSKLKLVVENGSEDLQLGVDESYSLYVGKSDVLSIIGEATIEAKTVYGALRGLEVLATCFAAIQILKAAANKCHVVASNFPLLPVRHRTAGIYDEFNIKQIVENVQEK